MKLKAKFLPHIVTAAGILAFGLRLWLLTGMDEKGLFANAHPAGILGYALIPAVLIVLFLLARSVKGTPRYPKLFKKSLPACIGCCVGGTGILIAAIDSLTANSSMLGVLTALAGLAAAGSLVIIGICRAKPLRPSYWLHAAVTLFFMLYTLQQYQTWNTEPQLQCYFPQLLASVCLMISAYYRTALDAGEKVRTPFLFFNYSAVFFSLWAMAGSTPVFHLAMTVWTIAASCSIEDYRTPEPMELPENVKFCLNTLKNGGYTAYVVGGCVRDHLLGIKPHDYDMCTNATPQQVCDLFSNYNLIRNGEKHGTIGVIIEDEVYEITTFRTEGDYTDRRHPGWVEFVDSIREDLARRDFTVNAIAFSPARGYADPFGGQQDLRNGILRAVGDPETRFHEDALRILRGVRFAVKFRLTPDPKTLDAMISCAPLMEHLARERILTELCGLLPLVTAADLIAYRPILLQVLPELADTVDFAQNNPHHIYDVYTHIAHTVENAPREPGIRLAALLHDIGKPHAYSQDENGVGHFYGHAQRSAEISARILERMKVSNAMREQVLFLVENHMVLPEADKKFLRRRLGKYGQEAFTQLLALQKADLIATGTRTEQALAVYDKIDTMISEIVKEDCCLHQKDLAVNGKDLLALGMTPGPKVGACLDYLLEQVLDETLPNEKEPLLAAARAFSEK